jgi:MATE family multidrug resistance protein
MEVRGVAWATVIAQFMGLIVGLWVISNIKHELSANIDFHSIFQKSRLLKLMIINRDLFLRSVCVITAVAMFTAQGAHMGELVLAANGILILFLSFLSHGLDGFAHAAEILVGQAVGENNRQKLRKCVFETTKLAFFVALGYICIFYLFGELLISLITDLPAVQKESEKYLVWVIIAPIVSVWAFQLDGIFIGATRAKDMRNAMFLSFAAYLICLFFLVPAFDNHGLWLAFTIFMSFRGATLLARYPQLEQQLTSSPPQ